MNSVIKGDIDKLGILYERYKAPLYAYFLKLTGGKPSSSEDLVQNVFYKALKYKHSFRGNGEFARWLFSIAHNLGIDYIRHEKKNRALDIDTIQLSESSEYDLTEFRENKQQLYKALDRISNDDRELLILSKIKCLKYSQIAEICNISEVAVKTRVFRALKRLRDKYYQLENCKYERE